MRRIVLTSVAVFALLATAVAGAAQRGTNLSLVAYSTPREAYAKLIPMFQATPQGKDVSFSQSYGAMVTDSVVVFAVRDGNPKHIRSWDDLLKPGVEVITPNPFTSGGARWNVMAAYGAWRKLGKTKVQAQQKLLQLFQHVAVQDKSARDALNTFLSGKGDVLLTYENEAIGAQLAGQKVQYVIPGSTILIENPIAVTKTSGNKDTANAFIRFLKTPAAQQVFADRGYRPILKSVLAANRKKFPVRPGQFTIDQLGLGGWTKVQKDFFDPDAGVMAAIERKVGGATGGATG